MNKIKRGAMALAMLLSLGSSLAIADTDPKKGSAPASMAGDDKKFFQKAAQAGMTEVQMAQVASTKATSGDNKSFAAMMIKDHGAANEELKALATAKGVTLPSQLDGRHNRMVRGLEKKDAEDFDKAYIKANIAAHKKAVDLFEDEAKGGHDAEVKAFAQKTLPTLKHHLAMAKQIKEKM